MGKVSHEETEQHALTEYNKYQKQLGTCEADELDKYLKTFERVNVSDHPNGVKSRTNFAKPPTYNFKLF